MSVLSVNQQVKQYLSKLETASNAGGPLGEHSAAKLNKLAKMDRTARFKWICANELGLDDPIAPRRNKREDTAVAMAEAVGFDTAIDPNALLGLLEILADQAGVQIIAPAIKVVDDKPKARKAAKTSRKAKVNADGTNRWRKSTLKKLGYKSGDGQTFKHKGTRWLIVDTDREFAYAIKA